MAFEDIGYWTDGWVDELMNSIERDLLWGPFPWMRRRDVPVYPRVNLYDEGERLVLQAFVPGVPRENLDVVVESDHVRLSGERPQNGAEKWHRRERLYGDFQRTVSLPVEVEGERAEAELHDGVLTLRLPKTPKALPRRIEVKAA